MTIFQAHLQHFVMLKFFKEAAQFGIHGGGQDTEEYSTLNIDGGVVGGHLCNFSLLRVIRSEEEEYVDAAVSFWFSEVIGITVGLECHVTLNVLSYGYFIGPTVEIFLNLL